MEEYNLPDLEDYLDFAHDAEVIKGIDKGGRTGSSQSIFSSATKCGSSTGTTGSRSETSSLRIRQFII